MSNENMVFVSGATGFIARHVILELLNCGYSVKASVRALSRADDVRASIIPHLVDKTGLHDRLSFVKLDLLADDGWSEAVSGCNALIHTASPFPAVAPENPQELVRPAVDGALRALRAANSAGIERVVLTSSVAAIWYTDLQEGRTSYDETYWSDLTRVGPYPMSKTLAERAAWDFVTKESPSIGLTVINPALVIGVPLSGEVSTSLKIVRKIFRGGGRPQPRGAACIVDVRDVARMHVQPLSAPESIGKRIISCDKVMTYQEIAEVLHSEFPERNISTELEDAPDTTGREGIQVDNRLARSLFGIAFTPTADAIRETGRFFASLERASAAHARTI